MPTKKAPSKAQLAARKKFVEMVRAKSKAKKTATKKAPVKKVSGLDKVVRKGKKTDVKYSRVSGSTNKPDYKKYSQTAIGINNIDRLKNAIKIKEGLEHDLKIYKTISLKNRTDQNKLMIKVLPQLIRGEKIIIAQLKKNIK